DRTVTPSPRRRAAAVCQSVGWSIVSVIMTAVYVVRHWPPAMLHRMSRSQPSPCARTSMSRNAMTHGVGGHAVRREATGRFQYVGCANGRAPVLQDGGSGCGLESGTDVGIV